MPSQIYKVILFYGHESCLVIIYLKKRFFFFLYSHIMLIYEPLLSPLFLFISLLIVGEKEIDAWLMTTLIPFKGMKRYGHYIHRQYFIFEYFSKIFMLIMEEYTFIYIYFFRILAMFVSLFLTNVVPSISESCGLCILIHFIVYAQVHQRGQHCWCDGGCPKK